MLYYVSLWLKIFFCSIGQKGVAIILSPEFYNYYKLSGAKPLIILDNENNEEFGRFIGIHLSHHVKTNNKGAYSKKKKIINLKKSIYSFPQHIIQ